MGIERDPWACLRNAAAQSNQDSGRVLLSAASSVEVLRCTWHPGTSARVSSCHLPKSRLWEVAVGPATGSVQLCLSLKDY